MNFINIYLIILTVAIIFIAFKKNDNIENFVSDQLTESIENLGIIAKELVNNGNYKLPGSLDIPETLTSNKLHIKTYFNLLPPSSIIAFHGNTIPEGWGLCDGKYYLKMEKRYNDKGEEINNTLPKVLTSLSGHNASDYIQTPDLRDRFVLGRDPTIHSKFESGGSNYINIDNLPEHSHTYDKGTSLSKGTGYVGATGNYSQHSISNFAIGINHSSANTGMWIYNSSNNKVQQQHFYPKYYVLNYIMKL